MQVKPLIVTWLLLLALTGLAGMSADLIGHDRLGVGPLIIVAAATLAKVRLILARYLRLDRQPGFLSGFTFAATVVVVVVTASLLLPIQP